MKGLRWLLGTILLLMVLIGIWFLNQEKNVPVQDYVAGNYLNEEGLLLAYPNRLDAQILSESLGMYLKYLIQAKDEDGFHEQVEILKKYFLHEEMGNLWIRWEVSAEADSNALIDDVRIAAALKQAAHQFKTPEYELLADRILHALEKNQRVGAYYVDFYDWKSPGPGDRITLSYLTSDFFENLPHVEETQSLLTADFGDSLFFPEYYHLTSESFQWSDEVNMIDQLLIAINRQAVGESSPLLDQWIKAQWEAEERIYGKYWRSSQEASVEYESLAVYALLVEYLDDMDESQMASQVKDRAIRLASRGILKDAHFFDYILYIGMSE